MRGQVPPQIIPHAVFRVDVAVNGLLADTQLCPFLDHPVTDLLGRPTVLDPFDHTLTQLGIFDQFAIPRAPIRGHQMRSGTVVAVMFGHALITEMVPLELTKDR